MQLYTLHSMIMHLRLFPCDLQCTLVGDRQICTHVGKHGVELWENDFQAMCYGD